MTRSDTELDGLFSEDTPPLVNIGFGEDQTIEELVTLVKEVVGFKGSIQWDTGKPDGTMRKIMDSSKIRELGWQPSIQLREGIQKAYEDFLKTYN